MSKLQAEIGGVESNPTSADPCPDGSPLVIPLSRQKSNSMQDVYASGCLISPLLKLSKTTDSNPLNDLKSGYYDRKSETGDNVPEQEKRIEAFLA